MPEALHNKLVVFIKLSCKHLNVQTVKRYTAMQSRFSTISSNTSQLMNTFPGDIIKQKI